MAQQKVRRWANDALGTVLLFVAYFVTARLGLLMDAVAGFATLVWPPTGIALAALFLFGTRLWPGVLAGALFVNLVAGATLPEALAIGTGNTLEALAGSWLLRRVARFDPRLERINDVISLVLLGAICSTAISAAVGVASLLLGGTIAPPLSWLTFRAWWFGDMLGDLVVAPLLFVWISRPPLARSLLYLQTFLGVAAVTALTVAAAIAERSRAVDARDEFLAMASHELRTPLTALLLHIQAEVRSLRRNGPVREREEALRQVESTQRMALRLAKLIGDLLEVSRIVWGRFQPEREDVDLAALVQESLARQEEQLQHARCPVHLEVEGAVRGHWDRGRLDQVIDNLIGNAAKYGAGKPIEVRLQGRAEDVLLEVRDHGIGIDPADHARVFERFERAVSRKQFGGFGLGLWISRKIVEAHGGSISLMSESGAGCTFSVELPRSASTS